MTDFKNLNPTDFEPLRHFASKSELREEIVLMTIKGIIYINSKSGSEDMLSKIFELLMKESMKSLKKNQRELKNKYPTVKSFADWGEIAKRNGIKSKDSIQCLIKLLIPIERKRRQAELAYYGQVRLP